MMVARGMKASGAKVVGVGLRDQFDAELPGLCDVFAVAGLARPGKWIRVLRKAGASEAVMVGGVRNVGTA